MLRLLQVSFGYRLDTFEVYKFHMDLALLFEGQALVWPSHEKEEISEN